MPCYHSIKFSFPCQLCSPTQTTYWEWLRIEIPTWNSERWFRRPCLRPNPSEGPFLQLKNRDDSKAIEILLEDYLVQLPTWNKTTAIRSVMSLARHVLKRSKDGDRIACLSYLFQGHPILLVEPFFWHSNLNFQTITYNYCHLLYCLELPRVYWQLNQITTCFIVWNYQEFTGNWTNLLNLTYQSIYCKQLRVWAAEDGWGRNGTMTEINCTNWRGKCFEKESKTPHFQNPPSENTTWTTLLTCKSKPE